MSDKLIVTEGFGEPGLVIPESAVAGVHQTWVDPHGFRFLPRPMLAGYVSAAVLQEGGAREPADGDSSAEDYVMVLVPKSRNRRRVFERVEARHESSVVTIGKPLEHCSLAEMRVVAATLAATWCGRLAVDRPPPQGQAAAAAELIRTMERNEAIVRRGLERFRGREVKTVGDGFLATFDGPARAIRCASAIGEAVGSLAIAVRAGLHTGECEVRGDDIGGIAVHIGARVAALAGPGEVLVSRTVKDLVFGSGIEFEDRGVHSLKGVPGEWPLFAATPEM